MDPFKRIQSAIGGARAAVDDVILGYQIAPTPERAAVAAALSLGFLSLGPVQSARVSPPQIRLSAAGSLMLFAAATAALMHDDGREARYAVPFGAGAALALDEARPSARLAADISTFLGLGGLVRDLHRRGAVHRALRQLAGPADTG